jgi:hypothetical protein
MQYEEDGVLRSRDVQSYAEACVVLGLIDTDDEWFQAIEEGDFISTHILHVYIQYTYRTFIYTAEVQSVKTCSS